eukprot:1918409-Rhodomonas_salina.3
MPVTKRHYTAASVEAQLFRRRNLHNSFGSTQCRLQIEQLWAVRKHVFLVTDLAARTAGSKQIAVLGVEAERENIACTRTKKVRNKKKGKKERKKEGQLPARANVTRD